MVFRVVAIIVVVAALCPLTFAARVKANSQLPAKEECPDGLVCTPAPCDIENSNKAPGLECACLPSFSGEITWSESTPSGTCTPAPCEIENSNKADGLECACLPSYSGEITWFGSTHSGTCTPAPCEIANSNKAAGPECACLPSSTGEITWSGSTPSGTCTPAPCDIENSNMADGPECACLPSFTGEIAWSGSIPSGTCTPAPCDIVGSQGSGRACKCMPGLTGTITWDADMPNGECFADTYKLFKKAGVFKVKSSEDGSTKKKIKCCVSSKGQPTILQDLKAKPLPSVGSKRMMGDKEDCGYMFGDGYHNARKRSTCVVPLREFMQVTGYSFEQALKELEIVSE